MDTVDTDTGTDQGSTRKIGCEVLIRRGDEWLLGKVCFEGSDFLSFVSMKAGMPQPEETPKDYWKRYTEWRHSRFQDGEEANEIQTEFPNGFTFFETNNTDPASAEKFGEVVERAELSLMSMEPDDGYLRSYRDHYCYINMNPTIVANGKLVVG